jgi:uncharacterized protein YbgA (DUF1722 family)
MRKYPLLPIVEGGTLDNEEIRQNFIERIFAYNRLSVLFQSRFSRMRIRQFHRRHQYQIQAHSPKQASLLDALVSEIDSYSASEFRKEYGAMFMNALTLRITIAKHASVLKRILREIKDNLNDSDKKYIKDTIEDYRRGLIPLNELIAMVNRLVHKHSIADLRDQIYLHPHPAELMLRIQA